MCRSGRWRPDDRVIRSVAGAFSFGAAAREEGWSGAAGRGSRLLVVVLAIVSLSACVTETEATSQARLRELRVDPGPGGLIVDSGVKRELQGARAASASTGAAVGAAAAREASAVGGDGEEGRVRWNEYETPDGRLTRFYCFRPGYANLYYLPLLRDSIPDLSRTDVVVSAQENFLVDPRPADGKFADYRSNLGIPFATGVLRPDGKMGAELGDLVTITAPRFVLQQVDRMLEHVLLDVPQILIEARVVEVAVDDEADWGLTGSVTRGTPEAPAGTFFQKGTLTLPLNLKEGVMLTLDAVQDETTTSLFLEFIQRTTNSDVLSAPKMVVANGHRAVIETGGEVAVLNPTVNSLGEVSAVKVTYEPIGILLIVTPFVLKDDLLQIVLSARVSTVTGSVVTAEFADGPLENPVISRRDAYSIVNIRSGQTIAIGGLTSQADIDIESKVPVLGDIPLLGYLFKRTERTKRVARVIYFVTATIVEPSETLR
ncbi:MAG: type II and III secretion system protein [Planctomycetota bacterium]